MADAYFALVQAVEEAADFKVADKKRLLKLLAEFADIVVLARPPRSRRKREAK